jgi:heme-degrading monooxygenase HmoA
VFARLVRYQVPPEHYDEAVERFDEAAREIEQLDGFEHGYLLADPESGLVVTATFWRDRATLDGSDVRAGALRQRAVRAVEGSIECVDRVEVVAELRALEA